MQNNEKESGSGIKLLAVLAYILALAIITVFNGKGDIAMNLDNPKTVAILKILQAASVLFLFIIPALLFAFYWTEEKIDYLGVKVQPKLSTLFISATGMLLALPMINWLAQLNEAMQLPEFLSSIELWMKKSEESAAVLTDALTKGDTLDVLLLNLFVIAFMAAFGEELFFRGLLQKVLLSKIANKHMAIWIGAAIFSGFHMQFYGFFPRMLMGAYLGYLFLWSGSLWPGILAHFTNNGMAVYLIWLENRGSIAMDTDKVGARESELVFVLISAVMVVMSLLLVYKKEKTLRV